MKHIVDPEIEKYIEDRATPKSDLLNRIFRETYLEELKPHMVSGPFQGLFLSMITRMVNPKRVLELGTYTGYATLCLAEGLAEGGKIDTLERNEELRPKLESYFHEAGKGDVIDLLIGDAMEVMPTLEPGYDMVFIDADKKNYKNYYELSMEKIRQGGWIVVDNVLWKGLVIQEEEKPGRDTVAIKEFNNFVATDERVESIILPIRDGLLLARKLV